MNDYIVAYMAQGVRLIENNIGVRPSPGGRVAVACTALIYAALRNLTDVIDTNNVLGGDAD